MNKLTRTILAGTIAASALAGCQPQTTESQVPEVSVASGVVESIYRYRADYPEFAFTLDDGTCGYVGTHSLEIDTLLGAIATRSQNHEEYVDIFGTQRNDGCYDVNKIEFSR